ncbi:MULTISPECIES: inovirus-type Gp2 protein [unclassified Halomonas]|uniref:YagK/YfjJ domain-containing protein n=1 Tax=unclassified Halomonas TaxID=2609666 RepID=UPI001EF50ABA|nr:MULTISPECIES: inovirus-type Gp2 protein [unclassified Halomonas]MCG7592340.1 inovirus Gp2 family protein [Halomonas sp. McD50-5]MCG7618394.1 inovirus Gp2 family protein [Halomonas sp. McD50-4]
MKRRHYTITTETQYRNFDIYSNKRKTAKGHYVDILDRTFNGIEELFTHTSRINVIRFDLAFKNADEFVEIEDDASKLVSNFFTRLKRRLKAWTDEDGNNKGIDDIFHVFVRERSKEKKAHFHCAIAFKSISKYSTAISKNGEYQWIYKKIADAWLETCAIGNVNFGSRWKGKQVNHFYCVDRKDIDGQANLMKGLSYLSKVNTKEKLPKSTRMFTFSRSIGKGPTAFKLDGAKDRNEQEAA